MKVYIQNKSFKMVGKAKEIQVMLKQYQMHFEAVSELIEKNQNTYMDTTTSTNKMPKRLQYYLLIQ